MRRQVVQGVRRMLQSRAIAPSLRRSALQQRCNVLASTRQLKSDWSNQFASFSTEDDDVMPENEYVELADDTLDDIVNWLDGVEEMLEDPDITYSQGVLTIDLGDVGTWVLNRQIPNRQIWWSSPISGPRRYEYDPETKTWLSTREGLELKSQLHEEIADATGIQIFE